MAGQAMPEGSALLQGMLLPMLLTVLIETPLFFACGFRRPRQLLWFAAVNAMTNLLLNEFAVQCAYQSNRGVFALCCELAVVCLEWMLCLCAFDADGRKLFKTLLLTNAASYLAGLVLFL